MDEARIEPRFIQGRRYTDDATLRSSSGCWPARSTKHIAARIEELGGRAMPLNFVGIENNNVLFGEQLTLDGPDGEPIDLGHVGRVTSVDRDTIENFATPGRCR